MEILIFKSFGGNKEAVDKMKKPIIEGLNLSAPLGQQWTPKQCKGVLFPRKQCPKMTTFVNTIKGEPYCFDCNERENRLVTLRALSLMIGMNYKPLLKKRHIKCFDFEMYGNPEADPERSYTCLFLIRDFDFEMERALIHFQKSESGHDLVTSECCNQIAFGVERRDQALFDPNFHNDMKHCGLAALGERWSGDLMEDFRWLGPNRYFVVIGGSPQQRRTVIDKIYSGDPEPFKRKKKTIDAPKDSYWYVLLLPMKLVFSLESIHS